MEDLKFRGVPVFFDGREYIVPPLSVRQFRDHLEVLTAEVTNKSREALIERMNKLVPVIGLALRRNYPELTDEHLFDVLDLGTFGECMHAVQAASGMKAAQPGE